MTTKMEKISQLKLEYPTIRTGSEEIGYTELTTEEYEATIEQWANAEIAIEEKIAADKEIADEAAAAKEAAQAKLAALGLTADDLKALGLGNN
jgi:hypothetical protein